MVKVFKMMKDVTLRDIVQSVTEDKMDMAKLDQVRNVMLLTFGLKPSCREDEKQAVLDGLSFIHDMPTYLDRHILYEKEFKVVPAQFWS